MINTNIYDIIEEDGYLNKDEAYEIAQIYLINKKGVTTYFDNGLWYIVQSKILAEM